MRFDLKSDAVVFIGGDKSRFKRPVVPGDQLVMTSSILADKRGVMKFDCAAYVHDEVACKSEITVMERKL